MKRPDAAFLARLQELAPNISEFARQIGMPQPMVHSYVTGSRTPSYEFFYRLAEKGLDVIWLLTGVGAKERTPIEAQKVILQLAGLGRNQIEDILEVLQLLSDQKKRGRKPRKK